MELCADTDLLCRLCCLFPNSHEIHLCHLPEQAESKPAELSRIHCKPCWHSEKCQFCFDPNGQICPPRERARERARRTFREKSHSVQAMAMPAAIARA